MRLFISSLLRISDSSSYIGGIIIWIFLWCVFIAKTFTWPSVGFTRFLLKLTPVPALIDLKQLSFRSVFSMGSLTYFFSLAGRLMTHGLTLLLSGRLSVIFSLLNFNEAKISRKNSIPKIPQVEIGKLFRTMWNLTTFSRIFNSTLPRVFSVPCPIPNKLNISDLSRHSFRRYMIL